MEANFGRNLLQYLSQIDRYQGDLLIMEDLYSVKLPVFEGPLDLLLHLIRENKVDIYDIPISLITGQYLHYIEMMKELDLEIAGEFIVMAATLIHIKSRMLLPADEEMPLDEMEKSLGLDQLRKTPSGQLQLLVKTDKPLAHLDGCLVFSVAKVAGGDLT